MRSIFTGGIYTVIKDSYRTESVTSSKKNDPVYDSLHCQEINSFYFYKALLPQDKFDVTLTVLCRLKPHLITVVYMIQ